MGESQPKLRGRSLTVKVLGILNLTPDSFSDGGRWIDTDLALSRAVQMVDQGADAIDIGGESTRPGSREISVQEELDRIIPCLERLSNSIEVPISIDTRRCEVAQAAVDLGATIINDTAALRDDPELVDLVVEKDVDVVLMHRQGTPETMQNNPGYSDVIAEISEFFRERLDFFVSKGGQRDKVILDPGIGFGKRLEDNFRIAASLRKFKDLGTRLMLGASRKACTGALDGSPPDDRLPGSLAFVSMAQRCGVEWVRVHDVDETVRFLKVLQAIREEVVDQEDQA
ncbi:MAG: dihydropteroate synthase [Planctomycetia bacterium TMED53]|nr:MAG: dihydropteroate synthase [Planctomycetia bacterium TMED53]